ncbi:alpha/beta hydrolase [Rhizosphaericola mali]|uniref:Alpha/beta hydrolase n=1 Tax=Rhizosphaericola mali TaxID=2545455 RepID=A0A5P2G7C5_9BACT|nr:alpha/beta hydrolase fold domain-containing protein [Rhizosphaericola mali]QES89852.1 alpha/beta hydrolase [Rhizosphaericola mali]
MRIRSILNKTFILSVIFLLHTKINAQDSTKLSTFIYSIKDKDTLRLDYYTDPLADTANRPCLLYVFGGGFITGRRNDKLSVPFFKKMVKNGFNVVSIDYRLGFRKAFGDPHQKDAFKENLKKYKPLQFLDIFYGSINMAVEDLYDATNYVVSHANDLKINPSRIIAMGSSAGAITVLQGQNYIVNKNDLSKHLPADFNYAGVISMAGAIFSMKGDVKWNAHPAPILMFHGDADKQVPYDKVRIKVLLFPLKYGFYGSKHITKQLKKLQSPYWFYSVENAGHEMSYKPMEHNIAEIMTFYRSYIDQNKPLQMFSDKKDISQPDVQKKFGFADYLKGNFGGN